MSQSLEFPETVYQDLLHAAQAERVTPIEWIAARLPKRTAQASDEARRAARERLLSYAGVFESGDPRSADNESIDRDLAAAYGDDHEESP